MRDCHHSSQLPRNLGAGTILSPTNTRHFAFCQKTCRLFPHFCVASSNFCLRQTRSIMWRCKPSMAGVLLVRPLGLEVDDDEDRAWDDQEDLRQWSPYAAARYDAKMGTGESWQASRWLDAARHDSRTFSSLGFGRCWPTIQASRPRSVHAVHNVVQASRFHEPR